MTAQTIPNPCPYPTKTDRNKFASSAKPKSCGAPATAMSKVKVFSDDRRSTQIVDVALCVAHACFVSVEKLIAFIPVERERREALRVEEEARVEKEIVSKLLEAPESERERLALCITEGFAGIIPGGMIVDRRQYPNAFPIEENERLGVPKPRSCVEI